MKLLLLSADDLQAALPMAEAVTAMKEAFRTLSDGDAQTPQRTVLPVPGGVHLVMPGYLPGDGLATKLVSVFPGNAGRGKPVINGLVVVLDPATGEPTALVDGTFLTAWRTGAASGAATDLLARPGARTAALFGCGAQARTQVLALEAVRELEVIRVYARSRESVERFVAEMQPRLRARLAPAADPREAVAGADVVTTATTSPTPVFDGRRLAPGAHVNGVGSFTLEMQEVDARTVSRSRIFVDSRQAAQAEAGDLMIPAREGSTRPDDWSELGDVVAGRAPGRRDPDEITFFKSVGVAAQDVVAATRAVQAARRRGLGREVEL